MSEATETKKALFPLGRIVATPAAIYELERTGRSVAPLLYRHQTGDWGDCGKEDAQHNDEALRNGDRIFSVYQLDAKAKVWIITEWDRSATTILLPSDY
jgi:hypothetical protein